MNNQSNAPPSTRVREQRGWYFYDFANSAFSSTVLTLILGPYLASVAKAAAGSDGLIHPFGIPLDPRSWWSYLIAVSVVLQVLVLPLVGTITDRTTKRKELLAAFAYLGAICTVLLFFVDNGRYLLGGFLFLVANVAFGASIVIYNSFLAFIATHEERDAVSSKGWSIGYLGGGLALALNLVLFSKAADLGITESLAARINLASAGLWWALWTTIPLMTLRNPPTTAAAARLKLGASFRQFFRTLRDMRHYPQTLRFLIAFLLYNDAIQAVIALSGQFGNDELKIPLSTLSLAILMVQFVAFAGALLFGAIAKWLGAKQAIIVSLFIWTGALISIYISVRTTAQFFVMAAVIAIVLGGTQALSRSLFSRLIPAGKEAEYFGLYEISDKGTSWMAPLFFGITLQMTGNYRLAIVSLIVFFAAGLMVFVKLNVEEGERKAASAAN